MWIKICGNTRLDDCLFAAACGAEAVGFVFAPGKRTVTAPQVAEIVKHLPGTLEKIGVFTQRDARFIADAAEEARLTGLQLHGAPDLAFLQELRTLSPLKLIQVLHWRTDQTADAQRNGFATSLHALNAVAPVDALLIDSQTAFASGGTGRAFDWQAVAPLLRDSDKPIIAAGGLLPETVASAVAVLQPWGVDVSSGVELAPGQKDAEKIRRFVTAARAAGEAERGERHRPLAPETTSAV